MITAAWRRDLDLGDPRSPSLATPVNVPGVVVDYRPAEQRVTTIDFRVRKIESNHSGCDVHPKGHHYDSSTGLCTLLHHDMKRVRVEADQAFLLDMLDIVGNNGSVETVATSNERLFVQVKNAHPVEPEIVTFVDMIGNELHEASRHRLGSLRPWYSLTSKARLVLNLGSSVAVLDATRPHEPDLRRFHFDGSVCLHLAVDETTAYCALGSNGLQAVPLTP